MYAMPRRKIIKDWKKWKPIRRETWKAKKAREKNPACSWKGRPLRVHHTVTDFKYTTNNTKKRVVEERHHMRLLQQIAWDRGYNDISYSFVLFPSGRLYTGRMAQTVGAHTLGYNSDPAVSLVGNYENRIVTRRQKSSIKKLRRYLRLKYGAKPYLIPHSHTYATACPGRHVKAAYKTEFTNGIKAFP